jgi:hypothetical protein
LWSESMEGADISAWLRAEAAAFAGARPIDLLTEGEARDIIGEFRRLTGC